MYVASLEGIAGDTSVTYMVWLIVYGMPFLMCLVFSAFPFYAFSKTVTVMLSAAGAMTAGVVLYVSILHTGLPWFDAEDAVCQSAVTLGGFRGVISGGHYLLYFALFGLQFGILSGILALLAA